MQLWSFVKCVLQRSGWIFPSGKRACCSEHETYGPTTPGAISYIRVHPLPGRNDFIMCCAWSLVQNQNCMNRLDWSKYLCHVFKYLCPLPCQNLPTFLFKVIKQTLSLLKNVEKQNNTFSLALHDILFANIHLIQLFA